MSGEKCEGVGLAQRCSQVCQSAKYLALSRPTHIYRCTPSKRAVGHSAWATDAVPVFVAHDRATCPRASNSQRSILLRQTRLLLLCSNVRRSSDALQRGLGVVFRSTDASVMTPTDSTQRLLRKAHEAAPDEADGR
jgi:hypothetical protein